MDKVKELFGKFYTWHNKEVSYTNGDALLTLVIFLTVVSLTFR